MIHSKRVSIILWIFVMLNHVCKTVSNRGCIAILKEPKTKVYICTDYSSGFLRIPKKFPDFIAELTIENQKINTLDSSQLRNLPYLVNFTFNNNQLSRIITNSFAYLPQLVSLRLSGNNLFLKDLSFPSSSLIHVKNLKILDLSKNPLGFVPDYYFQSLKQLNILILSGAQKGFFIEENGFYGLSNLQVLDLSLTHLTTLPDALAHSFSSMQLQEFYLYKNPWNCDCNLQWLKSWFARYKTVKFSKDIRKEMKFMNSVELLSDIQPKCQEPASVQGKNLLSNSGEAGSIGITDFKCPPQIFTKDRNVEISRGQNLTLVCDMHANPGGEVVWSKNGMIVQKHWQRLSWSVSQGVKFKASLRIFEVEENDSGNWRCILTTNVGKISATFAVKVMTLNSEFDYKYILKYVGIGAVTIILLLVVIGIIIYCIYGFQIQNNRSRKTSIHDKLMIKNDSGTNYCIISRPNEVAAFEKSRLHGQYYNTALIDNRPTVIQPCIDVTHSPFSHYLVNGSSAICPLHGEINNQKTENYETIDTKMTSKMPVVDYSAENNPSVPCPIHGDVLSYLSTSRTKMSTTVSSMGDLTSPVYSKSLDEYILQVSSCSQTPIMTAGQLSDDTQHLSSVPKSSSFSFSAVI